MQNIYLKLKAIKYSNIWLFVTSIANGVFHFLPSRFQFKVNKKQIFYTSDAQIIFTNANVLLLNSRFDKYSG